MYRIVKPILMLGCFLTFALPVEAQSTDEFHMDHVYSIDRNGKINLQSDDADVTITGSDREDVRVQVHYKMEVNGIRFGGKDEFEMLVEQKDGNLRIYEKEREFQEGGVTIGSVKEEYTITIEAPQGVSLNLEGDDEAYRVSGIDGQFSVEADDAEIVLNNCDGDSFSISMDDGALRMDSGRGALDVEADDSEIEILSGDFSTVYIDADDSEMSITTRLYDEGEYRFDMDDGDLTLNIAGGGGTFDISHDNADIRTDQRFEKILNEENRSAYRLDGGSAKVSIETDDGNIELKII